VNAREGVLELDGAGAAAFLSPEPEALVQGLFRGLLEERGEGIPVENRDALVCELRTLQLQTVELAGFAQNLPYERRAAFIDVLLDGGENPADSSVPMVYGISVKLEGARPVRDSKASR
jgi:hypothetical protein